MEIRKISDNEIAIDTPIIETKVYNVDFLLEQKARLETELAEVNSILEKIEEVKEEDVKLEKATLIDLVVSDVLVDETI